MLTDTILTLFITFFACVALRLIMIPILHRMRFGQQVRDDGPQSHLKKSGTPTMSGIMAVLAIALGCLPFLKKALETLPVMGLTFASGFIDFLDDFLRIHRKQSEGLKAWQKSPLQLIVTGVLTHRLFRTGNHGDTLLPFSGSLETGILLLLGGLFVSFVSLVVFGMDGGVNLTDGPDGLCLPVAAVVALFFAAAVCRFAPGTAPVSGVAIGALLGFLLPNCYPAKVFIGDTGVLVLDGYAAAIVLMFRMPLFLMLVGVIYILEVISVMLQVGYFKATKGKWLLQMAPLHYHFELGGWSEMHVVTVFTICTVILSLAAWVGPEE